MTMSKETILILDKESHNRWFLKTLLENEKYIVNTVDTIDRALQNFSEFQVSGFITEYRVDETSTLNVIRELRKRFPEAYVMMLTDSTVSDKEYEEIIEAGVDDYFLKPFSSKRILVHIRKGLRQRSHGLQTARSEKESGRSKPGKNSLESVRGGEKLSFGKSII